MSPRAGERRLKYVGDRITLTLSFETPPAGIEAWLGKLRTTIGQGAIQDGEIIQAYQEDRPAREIAWRDLPMERVEHGWRIDLAVNQAGYFQSKAYAVDHEGKQHWPEGSNFALLAHPDHCRTANSIYCAWSRLFGSNHTNQPVSEDHLRALDQSGYTVIPPSGKLRDLKASLGHIVNDLGCRIVHLLPVNPTPTTFALMGRYGSPYAALDLTAVDPALVEFDKRSTGLDQFRELTQETHRLGARVFLDVIVNHTGWGSRLWEDHSEWFRQKPDGEFVSPGAWGTVWEDLVELDHKRRELTERFARAFLTWCERGVDGFRCDAGYMIPIRVWRYITARVRREFPETVFLLEGLGGAWETTEDLLTDGGLHWAYSELFQNYSGEEIARYLDYPQKTIIFRLDRAELDC